jgi:hypothetical protein
MQPTESENDFNELLAVLNDEELYRVRHRLNKKRKERLVDIITVEIDRREEIWRKEARRGPEPGSP